MKFILLTHKVSKKLVFINIQHIVSIAPMKKYKKEYCGILLINNEIFEVLEDIDVIINQINHKNNIPEII